MPIAIVTTRTTRAARRMILNRLKRKAIRFLSLGLGFDESDFGLTPSCSGDDTHAAFGGVGRVDGVFRPYLTTLFEGQEVLFDAPAAGGAEITHRVPSYQVQGRALQGAADVVINSEPPEQEFSEHGDLPSFAAE